MNNLELTSEEKKELEKRGFYVKKFLGLKQLLLSIIPVFFMIIGSLLIGWFLLLCLFIIINWIGIGIDRITILHGYLQSLPILPISDIEFTRFKITDFMIVISCLFIIPSIYIFLRMIYFYIIHGKIFYLNGKINLNEKDINFLISKYEYKSLSFFEKFLKKSFFKDNKEGILTLGICFFIFWYELQIFTEAIKIIEFYIIFGFFIFVGFVFFLRQLVEHFHPLYVFGNLGEKIQKLSPIIESQSKLIQSEFEKDQNFAILHSGFEKLSTTFSEIVGLVIKLETIEKKANKGNLFDSEKYINSLRSDIVIPLEELKKFLMKQREELRKSQQELARVKVGGNESSGNRELQSKRSYVFLQGLEKNIEALQWMIGKMG